jgi:hypothetical protein
MHLSASKVIGVVMVVAAVALAWPAISEFFAVDQCLDAGGSFNGVLSKCDFEGTHTSTPSLAYVPSPSGSSWRILLGAALGLVGFGIAIGKGSRS